MSALRNVADETWSHSYSISMTILWGNLSHSQESDTFFPILMPFSSTRLVFNLRSLRIKFRILSIFTPFFVPLALPTLCVTLQILLSFFELHFFRLSHFTQAKYSLAFLSLFTWNTILIHFCKFLSLVSRQQYNMNNIHPNLQVSDKRIFCSASKKKRSKRWMVMVCRGKHIYITH